MVLSVVDLLKNGLTGLRRPGNLRRRFPNRLLRLPEPLSSFCVVASLDSSTLDNSSSSDILVLSTSVVVSISESVSVRSNVVDTIIGPTVLERLRKNGGILRVTDVEGVPIVVDLARLGLRKNGGLTGLFFGLKREGLDVEVSSWVTSGKSVIISVSSLAVFWSEGVRALAVFFGKLVTLGVVLGGGSFGPNTCFGSFGPNTIFSSVTASLGLRVVILGLNENGSLVVVVLRSDTVNAGRSVKRDDR